MNRPRQAAGFAIALVSAFAITPATAAPAPSVPAPLKLPKVKNVAVKVDIVGYITITHDWDSTGPCQSGSAYTVEENFSFETGKPVTTRFTNTSFPGQQSVFSAVATRPVGSAITAGRLEGWRTTSDCASPQPEPPQPACRTAKGKLFFQFGLAGESGSDDELKPLIGRSLMLSVTRRGGGNQGDTCLETRPSTNAVGASYGDTLVGTNPMDGVTGAILPTGIDSIKALNLKRKLTRTVTLTGPCEAVRVANTAGGTLAAAPQTCWVKGKVVVTLKRAK